MCRRVWPRCLYFLIGCSWLFFPSSRRCHPSCSQDPRDAPPPTRAETREERMERKVCNVCLLPHVFFFFFFASYFRIFPDLRALLSVFSCLLFSWQRREKIERRQQEVETELKMCKSLSSFHLLFKMLVFLSPRSTPGLSSGNVGCCQFTFLASNICQGLYLV